MEDGEWNEAERRSRTGAVPLISTRGATSRNWRGGSDEKRDESIEEERLESEVS